MNLNATFRPIDTWPGERTRSPKPSPFRASWPATLDLLKRELGHLAAREVVIQLALSDRDIRLDGYPRAHARPEHPGVILAFESKYGPLKYATDVFSDWQDNVRAIALGLEALRKVDRYGITRRGEQYTGWKALPQSTAPTMTTAAAANWVCMLAGDPEITGEVVERSAHAFTAAYRLAARRTHPDVAGEHRTQDFQQLQEAKRVLDAHHGEAAHG